MQRRSSVFGNKEYNRRSVLIWCFASFALSVAGALIAAAVNGIYPFGEKSVLFSDLTNEYMPFLTELYDKIKAGEGLFYSWRTGAGGSFLGNIYYYLCSPFNLLALLFGRGNIQNVMAFLILLRQALAAFCATAFFSLRKNGAPGSSAAVCGLLYAFCGWFAAYYYSVIWLDVFFLVPVLLLGIERIIEKKSARLYIPVLVLMIFSNFYMAYIACIFSVVYWLYFFFTNYRITETEGTGKSAVKIKFTECSFFRSGVLFALSSVFCALLAAVVLVPLALQLSGNEVNTQATPLTASLSDISQQLAALFSGMKTNSNRFAHYANTYTGVLVLVALPLFFALKNVSVKEKLITAFVLLFFVLSFNTKPLDYMWHGFRWPNCYAFRESFLFSLFILIPVHRVLTNIGQLPKKAVAVSAVCLPVLLLCAVVYITKKDSVPVIDGTDVAVTAAVYVLIAVLLFVPRRKRIVTSLCCAALLAVSLADAVYTFSSDIMLMPSDDYEDFDANYNALTRLTDTVETHEPCRTEITRKWLANDGSFFGYNGLRQSSSTGNSAMYRFLCSMGMDTNMSNYAGYFPQTPAFNMLFGVKNIIERNEWEEAFVASCADREDEGYSLAAKNEIYSLYDFKYALPIGFTANDSLAQWQPAEHCALENQNSFLAALCGADDILIPCDSEGELIYTSESAALTSIDAHRYKYTSAYAAGANEPSAVFEFTAKRDGAFYIYFDKLLDSNKYMKLKLLKPDDTVESFTVVSSTLLSSVYNAKAGDKLQLYVYFNSACTGELTVRGFCCDCAALEGAYEKIVSAGTLQTEEFRDGYLRGTVEISGADKLLCTTIPYEKGWSITVDGIRLEDSEIQKIGGALMGIKLNEGTHTVEFKFFPAGLRAGAIISAATLAAGAVFLLIRNRKRITYNRSLCKNQSTSE